jgi:hypothetical protein
MRKLLQVLLPGLLATAPALATEPLRDLVTVDGRTGPLLPGECCWVDLPPSERLQAERLAELQCSAAGGPVGNFELANGRLSLLSLRGCGGEIPLGEIYPGLRGPVVASWVSGRFLVLLDPVCLDRRDWTLHRESRVLTIEAGVVVASEEGKPDLSGCQVEL